MILLIVTSAILFVLLGFTTFLLVRSLKRNRMYENFYSSSIDDVDAVLESLEELMYKRQLLSDDPDVKKLYKTISILHDILVGYTDVNNRRFIKTEKEEKKKRVREQ